MKSVYKALKLKYESEIAQSTAEIEHIFNNPGSIKDHKVLLTSVDELIQDIAENQSKLEHLQYMLGDIYEQKKEVDNESK